jgi:hypothetical protein
MKKTLVFATSFLSFTRETTQKEKSAQLWKNRLWFFSCFSLIHNLPFLLQMVNGLKK